MDGIAGNEESESPDESGGVVGGEMTSIFPLDGMVVDGRVKVSGNEPLGSACSSSAEELDVDCGMSAGIRSF